MNDRLGKRSLGLTLPLCEPRPGPTYCSTPNVITSPTARPPRRSAERQAYLLTLDGRLTHTATSRHAEGFAVDVSVDDGNPANPLTRRHWIAFRRWVVANEAEVFRLIGTPDRSWDWPHIEYVDGPPGFRSIEELLATARWCRRSGATACTAAERTESTRLER